MSNFDDIVELEKKLLNEITTNSYDEVIEPVLMEKEKFDIIEHLSIKNLGLTDVESLIKKAGLKRITSYNIYSSDNTYDKDGLFSEHIFGLTGTKDRRTQFAYIDFSSIGEFLQPPVIYAISRFSNTIYDCICSSRTANKYMKFIPHKNILELCDADEENAMTGYKLAKFIVSNANEIANLSSTLKKLFTSNSEKVIFTKYILVVPPDLRPIIKVGDSLVQLDSLNNIYRSLIQYSVNYEHLEKNSYWDIVWKTIQHKILELFEEIALNKISKKNGMFRNSTLSKRTDYFVSSVASCSPNLASNEVGIPYHMFCVLAENFIMHYIFYKTSQVSNKKYLDLLKEAGYTNITFDKVNSLIKLYKKRLLQDSKVIDIFKEIMNEIAKTKVVLVKRDPSLHRDSWMAYIPVLIDDSITSIQFPPQASAPHNLDYDGDSICGQSIVKIYDDFDNIVFHGPVRNLI